MRVLSTLGTCLWLGATAVAQPPEDPVRWSASLEAATPISPGTATSVVVSGSIQDGWHVYALEQLPGGPTPLKVSLADSSLAAAEGAPQGSPPHRVHDKAFGVDTPLYTGTVTVRLPVRLAGTVAAGSQQLTVNVRFQSCRESECRPPKTVHLVVPVEVSAHE
jgi:hypothetical protein